jgi:ketopantoate reductase
MLSTDQASISSSHSTNSLKPIVVIYGSGLIGTYLGASLALSGSAQVILIGRASFKDKIVQNGGVSLSSCRWAEGTKKKVALGDFEIYETLKSYRESLSAVSNNGASQRRGPDFLVVTMKRTGIEDAKRELKEVGLSDAGMDEAQREGRDWIWDSTTLITLQNGARSEDCLREGLGESLDIIEGMVSWLFASCLSSMSVGIVVCKVLTDRCFGDLSFI